MRGKLIFQFRLLQQKKKNARKTEKKKTVGIPIKPAVTK